MNKLIAIGAVGLAVVTGAAFWGSTGSTPTADLPLGAVSAQEAADVDTSGIVEMTLGAETSKVTIIEYASFTCPHCANFHKGPFKELKAEYLDTDKVTFIYRDVYFDRFGLWASMVARCAGPEKFFGISDMIYTQQREWTDGEPTKIADNLRRIGKVAGIAPEQVEACMNDSEKAKALVAWYQKNAEADDVTSTPTLVINGKKYSNINYADLKSIIEEKLAE